MEKDIEILIDENGNITFDLKGFIGEECVTTTETLEKKLGKIIDRKEKPEFNKRIVSTSRNEIRGYNR